MTPYKKGDIILVGDTTMKWNLKHLLGDKLIAF